MGHVAPQLGDGGIVAHCDRRLTNCYLVYSNLSLRPLAHPEKSQHSLVDGELYFTLGEKLSSFGPMSAATASRHSRSKPSAKAASVLTKPHRRFADAEGLSEVRSSFVTSNWRCYDAKIRRESGRVIANTTHSVWNNIETFVVFGHVSEWLEY